jgi:hypothetical protein
MRKLVIIALALISFGLATESASANTTDIGARVSYAKLYNTCVEADGAFIEGPYGYTCLVAGPGGVTSVDCDLEGHCTSSCNRCAKAPTGDVADILVGGIDAVEAAPLAEGDAHPEKSN